MLSLCPFDISVGVGAFVIGRSQISFFMSLHMFYMCRPILFPNLSLFSRLCSLNVPRYFIDFALLRTGVLSRKHFGITVNDVVRRKASKCMPFTTGKMNFYLLLTLG